jgi:superfamily II DNA or RNA helicase
MFIVHDTRKVRQDLTRFVFNYNAPQNKTRLLLYEPLPDKKLRVPKFYAATKLQLQVMDTAFIPNPLPTTLSINGVLMETPERPQKTVFNKAVAALRKDFGSTVIMPCGSGKTNAAIAIALEMGVKTAVLCHKNFLMEQWQERLQSFVTGDFTIGFVQQGTCQQGDFVLCSIPSLLSRDYPIDLMEFGLVVIDEVHHIPAKTYTKVLGKLRCKYTLGLTATPKRKDGLEDVIYMLVGQPCYKMKIPLRVDVQVNIVRCNTGEMKEIVYKNGNIGMATMVSTITKNTSRNRLIVKLIGTMIKKRPNSQGLLLSDRVQHLETLHDMIKQEYGDVSAIICGKINTDKREKDDNKVQFRFPITLSTFQMFSEAVDFQGDFIILATPKSNVEQSTGRILRGHSEATPVIIDMYDPVSMFVNMMNKRHGYYNQRGYQVIELLWSDLMLQ